MDVCWRRVNKAFFGSSVVLGFLGCQATSISASGSSSKRCCLSNSSFSEAHVGEYSILRGRKPLRKAIPQFYNRILLDATLLRQKRMANMGSDVYRSLFSETELGDHYSATQLLRSPEQTSSHIFQNGARRIHLHLCHWHVLCAP